MMKDLIDIGFYKVGQWKIENGSLKHTCEKLPTSQNALYSFVIENEVVYVGKTINTLMARFGQYEKPHSSQRTNLKIHNHILESLSNKEKVEIYIFVNHEPEFVGRFELNLSAGLEDSIINTLNPKWNHLGKKRYGEEAITPIEETEDQIVYSYYKTYKTLQKLGYSKSRICDQLYMTEEELLDLETSYHELTGK